MEQIGKTLAGLGVLLTTFSFTVFIEGQSRFILLGIGLLLLIYGFYSIGKVKKLRSEQSK